MKQKLITAFMVMCLLTVMLAMPVFASENTVSGSCGMYISWTLDLDTGVLELSGTGAMADYQYREDNPWRVHRYAITSIVVNEGITEIGQSAFVDCLKVTKVSLPDGITRIGKYAFNNAQALQEIVLPDTVTLIDESAFECCYGLQTVTFPKNLKTLGSRAFADTWLLNAQLPDGLESIGTYAFGSCDNLQKVTMTNSVTTLGENAFLACTNLVSPVAVPWACSPATGWSFGWTKPPDKSFCARPNPSPPLWDNFGQKMNPCTTVQGLFCFTKSRSRCMA